MCDMRYALTEQKREIHLLKELVKAMRISNPNARALGKITQYENIKRITDTVKLPNLEQANLEHPDK